MLEQQLLSLNVQVPEQLQLKADKELLLRLLENLLTNAIKYSPSGSTISIKAAEKEAVVALQVIDHGQGIAETEQGKIFEKFGQVEARQLGHTRSTGLGLTFCKLAAEAMGGTIAVQSQPTKGTTFTVALPAAESLQHKELKVKTDKAAPQTVPTNVRLLSLTENVQLIKQLQPLVQQLRKIEIYQYSKIEEVLKGLPAAGAEVVLWKDEIAKAVLAFNEIRYQQLLDLVDEDAVNKKLV